MKEVLFALNNIGYGGASKITNWLINNLLNNNYRVSIIANTDRCKWVFPNEVKVINIQHSSNPILRNSVDIMRNAGTIISYIKKNKVSLVVNYGDHLLYSLTYARLFVKFKLLISERTDPFSSKSCSDEFRRFLYFMGNSFVFQTPEARKYFPQYIQKKSEIIYNPVLLNKKHEIWTLNKSERIILNVGRIDIRQKRQDILIKAFAMFHMNYPDYKLWIVGDGDELERRKLEIIAEQEGVIDSIVFLGYRTDVEQLLLKARLFVLSSDYEGIPNCLIEALQYCVPVLSTDCSPGGARLLLNNGKHGKLVPCGDINQLSQEMKSCVRSNESLQELSKMSKGALDRFEETRIAEKWINFINHAI